ncbi:hypothetical protein ACAG24_012165 [Mycobacterium sp. pW049]|uniref:hypothetical protein n=1 Tax=[Mycobacterium] bulgaricum TaxID=3238985 RepID=UPI00351B9DD7
MQLTAIPSPLQLYPQVLQTTLANVDAQLDDYFSEPFPIIAATVENYAQAFDDAVTALQFGRSDEFFVSVARIVLQPLRSIVLSTGGFLYEVYGGLPENLFGAAIGPLLNGIAATGLAITDVFEAITTFDVVGLVNAVINIPARIIDGVLNGVPGTSFGSFDNLPGLLTPRFARPYSSSLITLLIRLDQNMGRAITPYSSSAVTTWSGPGAQSMMLTTEPATEPVAAQKQLPTQDEAALEESGPVAEELDLPTSNVPGEEEPAQPEEPAPAGEQEFTGDMGTGPTPAKEEPAGDIGAEPTPAEEESTDDTEPEDEDSSEPAGDTEGGDGDANGNDSGGEAS